MIPKKLRSLSCIRKARPSLGLICLCDIRRLRNGRWSLSKLAKPPRANNDRGIKSPVHCEGLAPGSACSIWLVCQSGPRSFGRSLNPLRRRRRRRTHHCPLFHQWLCSLEFLLRPLAEDAGQPFASLKTKGAVLGLRRPPAFFGMLLAVWLDTGKFATVGGYEVVGEVLQPPDTGQCIYH